MYWAFWKFCIPIMIFLFVFLPFLFFSLISSVLLCLNSHFFSFSHFQSLAPPSPPPSPLCLVFNTTPSFYSCAPFSTSAFSCAPVLSHFSSTSLTVCGQVAEQLPYYIHVSEMVITEEIFDEAVQFGRVQGDPTRRRAWWPECIPPKGHWRQLHHHHEHRKWRTSSKKKRNCVHYGLDCQYNLEETCYPQNVPPVTAVFFIYCSTTITWLCRWNVS